MGKRSKQQSGSVSGGSQKEEQVTNTKETGNRGLKTIMGDNRIAALEDVSEQSSSGKEERVTDANMRSEDEEEMRKE